MSIVRTYIKQLTDLKSQVPIQASRIIVELQEKIIPFVTDRQLFDKGIDGKGNRLQEYYPFTIALKKLKGEVYNRTTLLDTGEFYDDFFAVGKGDLLVLFSKNEKTSKLIEKYGEDIFLLTEDHNNIINKEIILPELIEWLINNIEI